MSFNETYPGPRVGSQAGKCAPTLLPLATVSPRCKKGLVLPAFAEFLLLLVNLPELLLEFSRGGMAEGRGMPDQVGHDGPGGHDGNVLR